MLVFEVPSEITDDTFWKRYHFRVHQVEKDEEIRKALLQRQSRLSPVYTMLNYSL